MEQGHSESSYVALSYVWGSFAARDQYSLEWASGSIFSLPCVLPAVILDAIAVTKSLGFRYLWVDKFCIDHSDNDMKHRQIIQMDSVYENAELTNVAAAGVDETHGLLGVKLQAAIYTTCGAHWGLDCRIDHERRPGLDPLFKVVYKRMDLSGSTAYSTPPRVYGTTSLFRVRCNELL
ncbi:heterokaryon incompatibility protein domain-containing protein [Trichoderma sp. SZMC 28014]